MQKSVVFRQKCLNFYINLTPKEDSGGLLPILTFSNSEIGDRVRMLSHHSFLCGLILIFNYSIIIL